MMSWLKRNKMKNKYVVNHDHEFMEQLLESVFIRNQSDEARESLINHICEDGARPTHTDRTVLGVLRVSTQWILYGSSDLQVNSGFKLFSTWSFHNVPSFMSYFTPSMVSEILLDEFMMAPNGPLLLRAGFRILIKQRMHTETYYECAQVVQENVAKCVCNSQRSLRVRNVGMFLEEFKECIPSDEGEACQFCYALLNHLRYLDLPEGDASCVDYMDDIARILGVVWKEHHQIVMVKSLNFLFSIISDKSDKPQHTSCCLAAVIKYIPMELAELVVKNIVIACTDSDESIGNAVSQIIKWLSWPCIENTDLWVLCFLRELATAQKYELLAYITECNIRQLANNLLNPFLWRTSFTVFSNMMLSFQHSPLLFHRCLDILAAVVDNLRMTSGLEPGNPLSQLVMLLYCMMHHYSGFPDLYEPVLNRIQDMSPPTPQFITSLLHTSNWKSDSHCSVLMERLVATSSPSATKQKKLEPGKTGLANLGNTCYMNSVIQSLFMCDQFRRAVLAKIPHEKENLMEMLQFVFAFLTHSKRPCITPIKFLKASRPSSFLPDRQQDCSEFLKYLLNQLHDDETSSNTVQRSTANDNVSSNSFLNLNMNEISKAERKKSSVLLTSVTMKMEEIKSSSDSSLDCDKSKELLPSLVKKYFTGKVQTTIRCMACGHKSVTVESFVDISLAFPNLSRITPHLCKNLAGGSCTSFGDQETESMQVIETKSPVPSEGGLSLNDLIAFYLKSEKLTEDNKYRCDQCRTLQDGEKSLKIIDSPQYLILTLLRFSYNSKLQKRTKTFQDVHYPCTLSIPVYETATSKDTDMSLSGQPTRNASKSSVNNIEGAADSQAKFDYIARLLAPKCDNSNQQPQSFQLYGLTGVIVHAGMTSECGHYYSYSRHSQDGLVDTQLLDEFNNNPDNLDLLADKWYCFNDRKVTSCTLNSFRNGTKKSSKDTPYVLIYRKLSPGRESNGTNIDPVLSPALMDAVMKDNEAYLKEQQDAQAKMKEKRQFLKSTPLTYAGSHYSRGKDDYDVDSTNTVNFEEEAMEVDFSESRFMLT